MKTCNKNPINFITKDKKRIIIKEMDESYIFAGDMQENSNTGKIGCCTADCPIDPKTAIPSPVFEAFHREAIKRYGQSAILAWHDDKVVGFINFHPLNAHFGVLCPQVNTPENMEKFQNFKWPERPSSTLRIACVSLAYGYRRMWLGTKLAETLIEWASSWGFKKLHVLANEKAWWIPCKPFWEELGFRVLDTVEFKQPQPDGESRAFIMERNLEIDRPSTEGPAKILVVDDNRNIVESFKTILEDTYEIITAYDGKEALEKAEKEKPNLVLLDLRLPEIDGFEVLKKLNTHNLEVVVVSVINYMKEVFKAVQLGAYDYITKPFDADKINLRVSRALEKQSLEEENAYLREQIETRMMNEGCLDKGLSYREAKEEFERNYIKEVLDSTNWNQTEAANIIKIHRNTLQNKMAKLGLCKQDKNKEQTAQKA